MIKRVLDLKNNYLFKQLTHIYKNWKLSAKNRSIDWLIYIENIDKSIVAVVDAMA